MTEQLHFHALEKEMATHSSVLAWRIPGMGEPGGLPSVGSHRVERDWNALAPELHNLCLVLLCFWENRCTERGHDCRSSNRYGGRSPADFPPGVAVDPTERQKEIWGRRETKWNSVNLPQNPLLHLGYLSRASSIMTSLQNCPMSS